MVEERALSLVAQGGLDGLRELEELLVSAGIAARIVPVPAEEGAKRAPVLALAVASEDAPQAAALIRARWAKGIDPDVLSSAESAVDLDAPEATCPACGEPFETRALVCAACGLRFG